MRLIRLVVHCLRQARYRARRCRDCAAGSRLYRERGAAIRRADFVRGRVCVTRNRARAAFRPADRYQLADNQRISRGHRTARALPGSARCGRESAQRVRNCYERRQNLRGGNRAEIYQLSE